MGSARPRSSSCWSSCRWWCWRVAPSGSGGSSTRPAVPARRSRCNIEPGWGVPRIGEELAHRGVIGSSMVFNVYARLNGDNSFEAGTYDLHKNMGVKCSRQRVEGGPADRLRDAHDPTRAVVEGDRGTRRQDPGRSRDAFLRVRVEQRGALDSSSPTASNLEGLLLARHLQDLGLRGRGRDPADDGARPSTQGGRDRARATRTSRVTAPYDIIKVASLIEAEAKIAGDRPLIASVIYNRLRRTCRSRSTRR